MIVTARPISAASSHEILKDLHWLPVHHRIHFKIATLTFKLRHDSEPTYLRNLLMPYTPTRTLRSSNQNLLSVPYARTIFGARAFRNAAPAIWNDLPQDLRDCHSLQIFKCKLKTFLFVKP